MLAEAVNLDAGFAIQNPKSEIERDDLVHLVGFRLGRQLYALPLDHVERALRMVAVTPVPEAPPWATGVIDLHGQVVPVVDLRQRFDQPPKAPALDDCLLVVQTQEQTIALVVDEVTEVLEVPAQQVEPPAEPLSRSRPLVAVVRRGEGLILVLDATRLLPPTEAT
jgi:purine-binding chemotaxis protein CheW